ncbi:MAG TPA: PAS domain S-box protein, partial [Alkalispirochaeta sp.]|nr:PAS domain S-box protein [Alkalispirochaeta sp.]
ILLSTRDITERKTAEHAAACAIEDQRILLDNVPTQIWYLTDITMYGRVNEAHARFLGFQKEDLAFRDMSDRLTADVVAACQLSNRRVFETCQTVVSEEWVPDASGEPRLLSITKTPQVNDQGNVEYVVCAAHDITVRTQWEDEAKDHEALLQKILDNTVDLIAIFDLDGSIKAVSRSHELLGYDLQSIVGSSATDFVHPDDAEAMVRAIRDIPSLQETRISEYRLLRSESDYVWVETHETVLRDADGNPQQLLVNARDISTRKRMEEALRQREQYYRSIYNSLRDAIIVVDENRTIIDCNTAFTELFGYHLSDVYGSSTAFLYSSPEEEKQLGRMMREHTDDAAFMFQPQYRNKAGAVFPGEKKIQLLKDELGNQKGFVGVIRDISERKRSEEEVQRQLAEKEILLKEVHHRIKNNMAQVESMLSLQAASSGIPQVQSALKEATSRVRSIRALYEKLLVGTDYADVSMKAYLESLIDSLKEVYDEHSAISLRRTIEDFSLASKDAISVGIMVNELLTNVFKYAFAGRSGGEVFIDLENTDSQVTLTIKDDGVGLDRATVASKSTGFGLSIVTMLVEQFDGTFTMESDNGTTSTVAFDAMHSKNAYSQ